MLWQTVVEAGRPQRLQAERELLFEGYCSVWRAGNRRLCLGTQCATASVLGGSAATWGGGGGCAGAAVGGAAAVGEPTVAACPGGVAQGGGDAAVAFAASGRCRNFL